MVEEQPLCGKTPLVFLLCLSVCLEEFVCFYSR